MRKVVVIGIAGGSASGKTSLAQEIYASFQDNNQVIIIKQDDYYKSQDHLSFDERVKTNYDHPLAFDNDLLTEHIQLLKQRQPIQKPIYDFALHTRSPQTEVIDAKDVIILEGLFVLSQESLRNICDILIYVDTDSDIRFIRRLKRDMMERQRTLESICHQYVATVKPMHEQFVEPSKKYAHVIIPEGANNHVAIDMLITKIKSILLQEI